MNRQRGFTLIELLVVIGVLGILATGLLAAVDPFEQLKKARDANNRNASIETLNALTRYYATHGVLPWYSTVSGCAVGTDSNAFDGVRTSESGYPHKYVVLANTTDASYNATVNACITSSLIADGELKTGFFTGLSTPLYVASGAKTTVIVCYAPEGKALRNDANIVQWALNTSNTTVIATCSAADNAAGLCLSCYQ